MPKGKKRVELAGRVVGRLTVIRVTRINERGNPYWLCRCSCGKEKEVLSGHLSKEKILSCGCLRDEKLVSQRLKHGATSLVNRAFGGTPEWRSYMSMKGRCLNPKHKAYPYYGAAGIKIDPAWMDFPTFLKDMGLKPSPEHTIERISNEIGYCKSNCRWATRSEQSNNRRCNHYVALDGVIKTVSQWERDLGFHPGTVKARIYAGWDEQRALRTPLRKTSAPAL